MLVELVIHNQAVGHSYSVWLHRVSCHICVVAHVCIIEIGHPLTCSIGTGSVEWGEACHIVRRDGEEQCVEGEACSIGRPGYQNVGTFPGQQDCGIAKGKKEVWRPRCFESLIDAGIIPLIADVQRFATKTI